MLVIFCFSANLTNAYQLQPTVEEFTVGVNDTRNSTLYFTNTTDEPKSFKVYSHRYNPEDEKILEERDFISLGKTFFILAPEETAEIPYSINIPNDILGGSYFSIIVIEDLPSEDTPTPSGNISINYGVGSVVAVHVEDDTDISQVFLEETVVKLRHKKPLNPLNTKIEYTIKNNSKFTFLISGTLGIFSKGEEPIYYRINPEELKLYPGAELSFDFEYKGTYEDLIKNKIVAAKIGTQFSNHLRENQMELNYLTQTVSMGAAFFTTVILIVIALVIIKKQNKVTKTKK